MRFFFSIILHTDADHARGAGYTDDGALDATDAVAAMREALAKAIDLHDLHGYLISGIFVESEDRTVDVEVPWTVPGDREFMGSRWTIDNSAPRSVADADAHFEAMRAARTRPAPALSTAIPF